MLIYGLFLKNQQDGRGTFGVYLGEGGARNQKTKT
jgi:hypothetical protein